MAVQVILDSNFLFVPSQLQLNIFEELTRLLNRRIEPILLSPTYNELIRIVEKSAPKIRRQASLALQFVDKCRLVQVERHLGESTDDVIVRVAAEWGCPVATNDQELRRRLRDSNVAVIFVRQKSHLDMEGSIT